MRELERLHCPHLDQPSQFRAGLAPLEQALGTSPTNPELPRHGGTRPWAKTRSMAKPAARRYLFIADALGEGALAVLDAGVPVAEPHGCRRSALEVIEIE